MLKLPYKQAGSARYKEEFHFGEVCCSTAAPSYRWQRRKRENQGCVKEKIMYCHLQGINKKPLVFKPSSKKTNISYLRTV